MDGSKAKVLSKGEEQTSTRTRGENEGDYELARRSSSTGTQKVANAIDQDKIHLEVSARLKGAELGLRQMNQELNGN